MHAEIINDSSNPYLNIKLLAGESIWAESGTMMYMTTNIDFKALKDPSTALSLQDNIDDSEMIDKTIFNCLSGEGEIAFAPPSPGSIQKISLMGESIIIDGLAFLASTIELDAKIQGSLKNVLSGKGLYLQKFTGYGNLFLKSFGSITVRELVEEETLIVDTGHLVAFDESIKFKLQKPKDGKLSHIAAGEWIVCKFHGPGRVWIQSRNRAEFAKMMSRFLRKK